MSRLVHALARRMVRHAVPVASTLATVMLVSWAVSIVGVFALHLSVSDLILWPAVASFVVSGWILAVRRPGNPVGWLLLMTSVGLSFLPWSVLSAWMLQDGIDLGRWTGGLSNASFVFDVGGLALLLPLVFPDGRLPSDRRRWRIVLIADVLYMVFAIANLFDVGPIDLPGKHRPLNPFGLPHAKTALGIVISLCIPCLLTGFVGSFAALIVRWRSADEGRRAQLKWVILALVVAPVPFILHDVWSAGSDTLMTFVLPLVPVAIAVSVLRYRLYEIDRIVSRTVTYAAVTALVVVPYVLLVLAASRIGSGSSVTVAALTLLALAAVRPAHRRLQRVIDRRFNRERYDTAATVDAFALRLRDTVDPDVVTGDLLSVAAQAMQPSTMSLWVAS